WKSWMYVDASLVRTPFDGSSWRAAAWFREGQSLSLDEKAVTGSREIVSETMTGVESRNREPVSSRQLSLAAEYGPPRRRGDGNSMLRMTRIPPPHWVPEHNRGEVCLNNYLSLREYDAIQRHRDKFLAI